MHNHTIVGQRRNSPVVAACCLAAAVAGTALAVFVLGYCLVGAVDERTQTAAVAAVASAASAELVVAAAVAHTASVAL